MRMPVIDSSLSFIVRLETTYRLNGYQISDLEIHLKVDEMIAQEEKYHEYRMRRSRLHQLTYTRPNDLLDIICVVELKRE